MSTVTVDNGTLTDYAVELDSGVITANTQRVVIATDQPAVPVSGTVTATTGGLTDTQLRASAVPVTAAQATAANLNATVVQGTGTNLHTVVDSGTITSITNAVTVSSHAVTNAGTFAVQDTPARPSTSTLTNVASSATSVTLLSAAATRLAATIWNDSTQVLYVKFGTTASSTSATVKMPPDAYYEFPQPCYTGRVDGIWASANGNARITELTP